MDGELNVNWGEMLGRECLLLEGPPLANTFPQPLSTVCNVTEVDDNISLQRYLLTLIRDRACAVDRSA